MHDNDVLSVPRLWTAMRADIYQHWRGFAIAASAAAAVLMLVSVASGQSGARWDFHAIFLPAQPDDRRLPVYRVVLRRLTPRPEGA